MLGEPSDDGEPAISDGLGADDWDGLTVCVLLLGLRFGG